LAIIAVDTSLLIRPLSILTTAKLSSGAAATPKPIAKDAPLAPWQTPTPRPESGIVSRLLSSKPIIDTKDPLVLRADRNKTYTALFTAYLALDRMQEAAQYATTRSADAIRNTLDKRFKSQIQELIKFISSAKIDGLTVIAGTKQASATSTVTPKAQPTTYSGATVSSVREDPIAGLTGTEKLTFSISKDGAAATDIVIDLAQVSGTLNVDNVATYINAQLEAAQVGTRVEVNRKSESAYGLTVSQGSGEVLSIASEASSMQPAVYVAGTTGTGTFASGFLQKLEDVSGAVPTQAFFNRITAGTAATAGPVATDSDGNVYVVGSASGDVGGEANRTGSDASDVMLSKYDAAGNLVYQRLLGATADSKGLAITVDANDNVIVAGRTDATLNSASFGGATDSFVTKFDSEGQELWTRQAGSFLGDAAMTVSTDASGNVFLAGRVQGTMSSASGSQGGEDAYVTKLDSNGNLQYTKQFGTSSDDNVSAIKVDANGDVIVAGSSAGNGFVRKYAADDAGGTPIWAVDLGALGEGATTGLAIDDSGRVLVSGYTSGSGLNGTVAQAYQGGVDGFLTRIDDSGTSASISYVSYLGTAADDRALGVSTQGGNVYLTGDTGGSLDGQTLNGERDSYAARLDVATGTLGWSRQFGGTFGAAGIGIVVDPNGTSAATKLGFHEGTLIPESSRTVTSVTSARAGQYFTVSVNGGQERRITIGVDDSFSMLALKLNSVLGSAGRATADGGNLSIKAKTGADIQIGAGTGNLDALASLGLRPSRLFGAESTSSSSKVSAAVDRFIAGSLSSDKKKSAAANVYDLGLGDNLTLSDKKSADDALNVIKSAMRKLRDAYRFSVTGIDPNEKAAAPTGPMSAYMQKQIAQYQTALSRIEGQTGTSTGSGQSSLLTLFGV